MKKKKKKEIEDYEEERIKSLTTRESILENILKTNIKFRNTETHHFIMRANNDDYNAYSKKTGKLISKCRNGIYTN